MIRFFRPTKYKISIFLIILVVLYFIPAYQKCWTDIVFPEDVSGKLKYEEKCENVSMLFVTLTNPRECNPLVEWCSTISPKSAILKFIFGLLQTLFFFFAVYLFSCLVYLMIKKIKICQKKK
ncbi:MAG: hypothetical protein PHT51_02790 [Patescibacteria group bacterium]|nr:hypothetical protein [Patescibacteria group bacterium]MDD4610824.1 hypothetical protein [Patescibacteria group bacterium]